jgi:Flp pilus assembly protein TadG
MRIELTTAFGRDTKGGVAVIFGLVIPVLIGFAGLGIDGAYWLMERNRLQASSDSAAISAAQSLNLDGDATAMSAEARKILTKIYGASVSDVRFNVEYPPTSGAYAGSKTAVAINAEKDEPVYFAGLFGVKNTHVTTRSVANVDSTAEACLLALSPSADKAINISGSTTVSLACGIAANSDASDSVYLAGSSDTTASGVSAVGDVFQSSNAKLTTDGGPVKSSGQAVSDPYGPDGRNLQLPASSANCTQKNLQVHSDVTLQPGRYCGGIAFTGGDVKFAPGVYISDGGDFKANGNVSLSGQDVTFVLTGKGNNVASVNINGGATADLHAPTSGTSYDGILFYQAAETSNGQKSGSINGTGNVINGGASLNLSGALYFPESTLQLSGGTGSSIACLQAIAQTVEIGGNTQISGTCKSSDGTEKISRVSIELVE